MDASELRAVQAPLKEKYRDDAATARIPAAAEARLGDGVTCTIKGWAGDTVAGLHPAAGGDGSKACSADMLLEALVACAGVTLNSVATVMGVELRDAVVRADATWDARGTLGLSKETPIGLTDIALTFELDTDADEKSRQRLVELTERYCVIYQTLKNSPQLRYRVAP